MTLRNKLVLKKKKENEGSVYTGFVDHIHKITGIFKQLDKTSL